MKRILWIVLAAFVFSCFAAYAQDATKGKKKNAVSVKEEAQAEPKKVEPKKVDPKKDEKKDKKEKKEKKVEKVEKVENAEKMADEEDW